MTDVTAIVVALLVCIPATISAVAALRTRGDLKTNHGQRPGHYIETTALAVLDHGRQLDGLAARLDDHLAEDLEQFASLHDVLRRQDERDAEVAENLLTAQGAVDEIAHDLADSHARADAIGGGEAGEAADAASRSSKTPKETP